jgi:hypothetical protein
MLYLNQSSSVIHPCKNTLSFHFVERPSYREASSSWTFQEAKTCWADSISRPQQSHCVNKISFRGCIARIINLVQRNKAGCHALHQQWNLKICSDSEGIGWRMDGQPNCHVVMLNIFSTRKSSGNPIWNEFNIYTYFFLSYSCNQLEFSSFYSLD